MDDAYSDFAEEDSTLQLHHRGACWLKPEPASFTSRVVSSRFVSLTTDPYWCHPPGLTNGEASCRSPGGGASRGSLGTRCEMSCDRGYRLVGRSSIQCLGSRRWSGTSYCRSACLHIEERFYPNRLKTKSFIRADVSTEMRCHVLPLIPHGRYTCTQGFAVDSRCDFICAPGYRVELEHSRTCQHGGSWSGAQPVCSGERVPLSPPPRHCRKSAHKHRRHSLCSFQTQTHRRSDALHPDSRSPSPRSSPPR